MSYRKNPKNYDGTKTTQHHLQNLLPAVFQGLFDRRQQRPDLILAYWPELIGPKFCQMTEALSFDEGVLTVRVKNASLYSILCQHEKSRLVTRLKEQFPKASIKTIHFRIG
jgi:hypothetical protein